VDNNKRVTPDMWLEHRARRKFQGPHCLCPLLRTTNKEPPSTEDKIWLKGSADHLGEYVAECPNERCGYFGQLSIAFRDKVSLTRQKIVPLERKYALYGILVRAYAPRLFHSKVRNMRAERTEEENIFSPEQVLTTPRNEQPSTGSSRPLKRTYAVAGQQQPLEHQEKTDHCPLDLTNYSTTTSRTKWTKFSKLDRMRRPGLCEADFRGLFVKCDACERITTRNVFRYHLEGCDGCEHGGDTDTSESEQEV
jgi:hypothetical protein